MQTGKSLAEFSLDLLEVKNVPCGSITDIYEHECPDHLDDETPDQTFRGVEVVQRQWKDDRIQYSADHLFDEERPEKDRQIFQLFNRTLSSPIRLYRSIYYYSMLLYVWQIRQLGMMATYLKGV